MAKQSKKVPLKPLSDRVVLEKFQEKDQKTSAGIILPDSVEDKSTKKGIVVSVGEGKVVDGKVQKPQVKVGDAVLYSWGEEIEIKGKKYIIVSAENIMAIIN